MLIEIKYLIQYLKIIQQIKNINDDKLNNQTSLFGTDEQEIDDFDF